MRRGVNIFDVVVISLDGVSISCKNISHTKTCILFVLQTMYM